MSGIAKDILIADDERSIRLMLRTALEASGYRVREAPNSRETLEEVHRQPPDVLVLDLYMPALDGINVLRRVKARGLGSKPSVIILTGGGTTALLVEAIRLGASDFLHKPVTPDDLRLSVASVLNENSEVIEPSADSSYAEILRHVRKDLGRHNYQHAGDLLKQAAARGKKDTEYLKLLGALHEAEGRPGQARRFYRLAEQVHSTV